MEALPTDDPETPLFERFGKAPMARPEAVFRLMFWNV